MELNKEKKIKSASIYYHCLFLLALIGTATGWFVSFKFHPVAKLDVQDIIIEGLILSWILISYIYIARLNITALQLGWSLITLGRLIDFFNEFTSEPEFFDTTLEGILVISGLVLVVIGFSQAYCRLKEENELRKKVQHDLPMLYMVWK